jgi:hypothetical protein
VREQENGYIVPVENMALKTHDILIRLEKDNLNDK